MPVFRKFILFLSVALIMTAFGSCRVWNNVFGPKYGCPTNGKAYGAERILSGEKVPKTKKFRS